MRFLALLLALPAFGQVDFATHVHPILQKRCMGCHSGKAPQGGLSLESRESAARVLTPGSSELVARVTGQKQPVMPPVGGPLAPEQIATLKKWVEEGAPWARMQGNVTSTWTAPLEPRRVAVPPGAASNPIDRFLSGPNLRPIVSDERFARRAYLDLWGFTPTPEQLQAFLGDARKDKREILIDTLLGHTKNYSEHWITYWNDLLRNDQGVNYAGTRKSITPWLKKALESNMPYDRMVEALINPVAKDDPDGFLIGVNWRGDVNASQTPYMQAAQNTAQIFLGVNLKCASCHDSFVSRYKLKQSYGMAAIFAEEPSLELVRCDVKTGVRTGPEFLFPELGQLPSNATPAERRAAAAKLFTSPQNGRLSRTLVNRYWRLLTGHGLVEPIDEMDTEPWMPDFLDWLAADFAQNGYDLKKLLRTIMTSQAYQRAAVSNADKQYTFRGPSVRRITAEQFVDTLSAITGEWRILPMTNGAVPSREWQLKSTNLSRALGRPIRDQVYTVRNEEATTLQMLELANGEAITATIRRGARRLLGQLPPAPQSLFDSKAFRKGNVPVDLDISGVKQIWLLIEDAGSYDPGRTMAGWTDLRVEGPSGSKPVAELATISKFEKRGSMMTAPFGTAVVFDITGLGYTRLKGSASVDPTAAESDINGLVRFFVFPAQPDRERLINVTGAPPLAEPQTLTAADQTIDRLFMQTLSRKPAAAERTIAASMLTSGGKEITATGLEDLIWSLLLHPEFQYIY